MDVLGLEYNVCNYTVYFEIQVGVTNIILRGKLKVNKANLNLQIPDTLLVKRKLFSSEIDSYFAGNKDWIFIWLQIGSISSSAFYT
mmetsp:Transcript_38090/g.50195  ORF Transcript_38090/g.50195 Transcript_38090/m.50195 type:complete len:86 (+) Transcript_38090:35-292(+)